MLNCPMSETTATKPAQPRILFFTRKSNVGLVDELAKRSDVYFCSDKAKHTAPPGTKLFTLREAWKLRQRMHDNPYDLVVSCANFEPLWRQDRNWLSNAWKCLKKLFFNPSALGFYLLPWILAESKVPLAVFDWDDNTIIPRMHWGLLKHATAYFKTQTPRNPYKAFLFQDKRNDCLFNIVRQPVYVDWAEKLRPISIGITVEESWANLIQTEKKTDVFFAGAAHYSRARTEGLRLLEELRDEGYKIDLLTTSAKNPGMSQEEFLRRCSQSWLVWSPEGAGWDCTRHYFAPLMGSVPLMNHPDTRRHLPLIDGIHGFYYGVEDDDLKRVVRLALSDKERLRAIAKEGQAFVRAHHTQPVLADYLISETLKMAAAQKAQG
jgi:hypothetical protein